MSKKRIVNIVGLALMAVSAVFLVRRVISLDVDMTAILTAKNAVAMGAFALVGVTAVIDNAFCWRLCLRLFTDRRIPVGEAFSVYARANVMKYLPGNVGHYAGRQIFGVRMGLRQLDLAAASAMEVAYSALSMGLFATAFSAREVLAVIRGRVPWGAFLGIGIVALATVCFAAFLLRKSERMRALQRLVASGRFWGTFALCTVLNALGVFVIVCGYAALLGLHVPLEFRLLPRIIAANYVALFTGFIVPGVPGGIGVREAVLTALLSPYIPEKSVLIAAFSSRIAMIMMDALSVPVSGLFAAVYRRKKGPEDTGRGA